MELATLSQYAINGIMLGTIYALVAVGFTLFFGVLNIINFAHGDVFTVGAFAALATSIAFSSLGLGLSPFVTLVLVLVVTAGLLGLLGAAVARYLVLPTKNGPPLNVLLLTMMLGTILRESVRLFYPEGGNPKPFPALLPKSSLTIPHLLHVRIDNLILLIISLLVIIGTDVLINRSRLGLAIRAVAQDSETAEMMGINYKLIVGVTFALGSVLAGVAGIVSGLYYNEINFTMGLMIGAIGFSSAIIGGLGNFYGAILGAFIFAFLEVCFVMTMPMYGSYKDVFAFAVVIVIMTCRPTGLIKASTSERV